MRETASQKLNFSLNVLGILTPAFKIVGIRESVSGLSEDGMHWGIKPRV